MAKTLKRGTCTAPGCGATCIGGRCAAHIRVVNRSGADPRPYANPLYRKNREVILSIHKICQACKRWPSTVVDHINNNNRDNSISNLQGLCNGCNIAKGKKLK